MTIDLRENTIYTSIHFNVSPEGTIENFGIRVDQIAEQEFNDEIQQKQIRCQEKSKLHISNSIEILTEKCDEICLLISRLPRLPSEMGLDLSYINEVYKITDTFSDNIKNQVETWHSYLSDQTSQKMNFSNIFETMPPILIDNAEFVKLLKNALLGIERSLNECVNLAKRFPKKAVLPIVENMMGALRAIEDIDLDDLDDIDDFDPPEILPKLFISNLSPLLCKDYHTHLEQVSNLSGVYLEKYIYLITAQKLKDMNAHHFAWDFEKNYCAEDLENIHKELVKIKSDSKIFNNQNTLDAKINNLLAEQEFKLLGLVKEMENNLSIYFNEFRKLPKYSFRLINQAVDFFNQKESSIEKKISYLRNDLVKSRRSFLACLQPQVSHEVANENPIRDKPVFKVLPNGQLVPFISVEIDCKAEFEDCIFEEEAEISCSLESNLNYFLPSLIDNIVGYIFKKGYETRKADYLKHIKFGIIQKRIMMHLESVIQAIIRESQRLPEHITQLVNLNIAHIFLIKACKTIGIGAQIFQHRRKTSHSASSRLPRR